MVDLEKEIENVENLENVRKFVENACELGDLKDSKVFKCLYCAEMSVKDIENAKEYAREFKKLYNELSASNFGADNLLDNGIYKLMGWVFDFRKFLKVYYIQYKFENHIFHKVYGINNLKKM